MLVTLLTNFKLIHTVTPKRPELNCIHTTNLSDTCSTIQQILIPFLPSEGERLTNSPREHWPKMALWRNKAQSSLRGQKELRDAYNLPAERCWGQPQQLRISALRITGGSPDPPLQKPSPQVCSSMWPSVPLGFSPKVIINIIICIQKDHAWKEGRYHPSPGVLLSHLPVPVPGHLSRSQS